MSDILHRRERAIREAVLIRAWKYRQRNHAGGAWYRLRRTLVDAAEVWVLDESGAELLERAGSKALAVGSELIPAKSMYVITRAQLEAIPNRRPIAVRLSAELLAARYLALVPHDPAAGCLA